MAALLHVWIPTPVLADTSTSPPSPPPGQLVDLGGWRLHIHMHTLLEKAEVPPPYVLVGHSYGGILARLYAFT